MCKLQCNSSQHLPLVLCGVCILWASEFRSDVYSRRIISSRGDQHGDVSHDDAKQDSEFSGSLRLLTGFQYERVCFKFEVACRALVSCSIQANHQCSFPCRRACDDWRQRLDESHRSSCYCCGREPRPGCLRAPYWAIQRQNPR